MQTSPDAVLARMRQVVGVRTDSDLASLLGLKRSTLSTWRSRGAVPANAAVAVAAQTGASVDWLLSGDPASAPVQRPTPDTQDEKPGDHVVGQATGPPPGVAEGAATNDPRLADLIAWLTRWWEGASEEERAWLLVELRVVRARALGARLTADPGDG